MLSCDRSMLMLQLQAYAACDDDQIRDRVQHAYATLRQHVQDLSGCSDDQLHEFLSYGMYLTAQAAMGGSETIETLASGVPDARHAGARASG